MKPLLLALLASSCASFLAPAASEPERVVRYEVDLSRPQTQYVDLSMRFPTEGRGSCDVSLPTWRPGRYTILDPAGTLFEVRAEDESGAALPTAKTAKSTWRVECKGSREVLVRYSIYANSLYDRTRHVDPTHAFLSGSSVFLYTDPLRDAPVQVTVRAPQEWRIATGLEPVADDPNVLAAADYDVLVDSPLEIGLHDRIDFEVGGVPHEIVIWPPGIEVDRERLVEDFTKIVEVQTEVFGRVPYGRYVFLVHGKRGAGGTEHLNSTIMQASRSALEASVEGGESYTGFLGLVSHEMFHTWNVKQLRPAGIHPYDYQAENHTDLLWVAEGTTSYYGGLTLARTGQRAVSKYLERVARSAGSTRRLPASRVTSLAQASWDTWIRPSDANAPNTVVDYYGKGSLTSLCLDMEIRRRSQGAQSLDSVMRTMFERFPLSGPGYRTEDLLDVLEESTGSSFEPFFASYVSGTEPLPFEEALTAVGLEFRFVPSDEDEADEGAEDGAELQTEAGETVAGGEASVLAESAARDDTVEEGAIPMKPYLGLRLRSGGTGSVIRNLLADGPAFESGLLVGDEILFLDGRRLKSADLEDRLEDFEVGDVVTLHVLREEELRLFELTLAGVPDGKYELHHMDEPSEAQRAAYESWIGQEWPEDDAGAEAPTDPEEGSDA